jgi:hypothetical protein
LIEKGRKKIDRKKGKRPSLAAQKKYFDFFTMNIRFKDLG